MVTRNRPGLKLKVPHLAGSTAERVTTVVPNLLYRMGACLELDGRISWAPTATRGFQPINCYLAVEESAGMLVDTGVSIHERQVLAQLAQVAQPNMPISIFLTRSEYECIGNLAPVIRDFNIDTLFTGGGSNPFDAFDEVTGRATAVAEKWSNRVRLGHLAAGTSLPLGSSGRFEVVAPALRILATYWAYDKVTKTLFTSDVFGHTVQAADSASPLIDAATIDPTSSDSVREHVLAKFGWLTSASTRPIVESIMSLFDRYDVEIVAPTHGCVLVGTDVVRRHRDLLCEVLRQVGA